MDVEDRVDGVDQDGPQRGQDDDEDGGTLGVEKQGQILLEKPKA